MPYHPRIMAALLALALTLAGCTGETPPPLKPISDLSSDILNPLFEATVQATEEALVNQLVASETMTGANGVTVYALPTDQLVAILKAHGRLTR